MQLQINYPLKMDIRELRTFNSYRLDTFWHISALEIVFLHNYPARRPPGTLLQHLIPTPVNWDVSRGISVDRAKRWAWFYALKKLC